MTKEHEVQIKKNEDGSFDLIFLDPAGQLVWSSVDAALVRSLRTALEHVLAGRRPAASTKQRTKQDGQPIAFDRSPGFPPNYH